MATNFLPATVPAAPRGPGSITELGPYLDTIATTLNTGQNVSVQIRPWAIDNTYDVNDQVPYNGSEYRSLVAGNVGNQPDTNPTQWKGVSGPASAGNHVIVPVTTAVSSNIAATTERLDVTASANTTQTLPSTRPATWSGKITVKNRGSGTITMAAPTTPTGFTMEMAYTISPFASYDFDLDVAAKIWMGT